MIKKILVSILPPVIIYLLKPFKKIFDSKNSLFDGDDKLFKQILLNTKIYGEYGCGKSTIWVANNSECQILGVDSSEKWIDFVQSNMPRKNPRHVLKYVDLGPILDWGFPSSYRKRENFRDYTDSIWLHELKPDTVLIDGRFRVCCFLTSLIKGNPGTKVIFDDYTMREIYHIVEIFVKPKDLCGRQALFIIPDFDHETKSSIEDLIEKFRYVLD
tara:strand:- start:23052 stop:23696 length:645 start_codon:yes stop_codon:yes gene_type:complete